MRVEYDLGSVQEFSNRCEQFGDKLEAATKVVVRSVASKMKAYAQSNAPWEDQTGNARQGLHYRTSFTDKEIRIVLYHTMSYGFWLELAHQRKYKILEESIESQMPELIEALKELLS